MASWCAEPSAWILTPGKEWICVANSPFTQPPFFPTVTVCLISDQGPCHKYSRAERRGHRSTTGSDVFHPSCLTAQDKFGCILEQQLMLDYVAQYESRIDCLLLWNRLEGPAVALWSRWWKQVGVGGVVTHPAINYLSTSDLFHSILSSCKSRFHAWFQDLGVTNPE